MDFNKDWKPVQNFFGVPVTLFGPMSPKKTRTIIQLIPTEAKALQLNESEIRSFNQKYPDEKKKWLKERNGHLLSILPAGLEGLQRDKKMIVAGLAYRLGEQAFTEKTFYLNCGSKVVQLKILSPLGEGATLDKAEKIVRSFKCDS